MKKLSFKMARTLFAFGSTRTVSVVGQARALLAIGLAVVAFIIIFPANAATIKRIRSVVVDKGEVHRIYLSPGLASVITFPCEINEAIIGREADLKAQVSPTTKRQLTLYLAGSSSTHTNLLVRCGGKRDLFVFDVIASKSTHQDVIQVRGTFGGPEIEDAGLRLVDSSEALVRDKLGRNRNVRSKKDQGSWFHSSLEIRKPVLVEESE